MQKPTVTLFNFGILFLALLSLNWNTNAILDQQNSPLPLAEVQEVKYTRSAPFDEEQSYASAFDSLGITLHPGNSYKPESNGSPRSLNHCKSLIYRTLKSLPPEPVNHLTNLTLYFSDSGRRGLGGGNTIILRCQNVTDEELVSVLVHEVGHIMDTGVINGTWIAGESEFVDGKKPVYEDDLSLEYYRLSWKDDKTLRADATKYDFVSGYGMSDPYEDFAEAYAYYVLHGKEFRKLALRNEILQKKYDFLKNRVFEGKEYANGKEEIDVETRHFDVTVLPYDMTKFFAV